MQGTTDYSDNLTLIRQYKNGNAKALEILTKNNLMLVKSIASRFTGRGYEYEDLVETGVIGLLKAFSGFDEKKGCTFSTYAFNFISGEIKRLFRDSGPIKVSRSTRAKAVTIAKAKEDFLKKYSREPKISDLSEMTSLSYEEISDAVGALQPISSIEEELFSGEGGAKIESTLYESSDLLDSITDRIALHQAISALNDTEQKIIKLRFYKNLTQTKVSQLLGISQVSVSRAEKKIIDKLRQEIL